MASKYEIIKNWIEDIADDSDIIQLVRQVNSWDGSLEDYDFLYMDELDELYGEMKLTDFLSKLAPDFNYSDDGFRATIYGIESCSIHDVADDIKDNIDEVVEAITNAMEEDDIWIPSSLEEKLYEE